MFRKNALYLIKKNIQKKKNPRKSSIWIVNPVQPVWKIIHKKTHTPQIHVHCSLYKNNTDTCIHIVYGCLTKSFVEKLKPKKKEVTEARRCKFISNQKKNKTNELFSMSSKANYQNYNFRKSRRNEKTLLEKQVTIFIGYRDTKS